MTAAATSLAWTPAQLAQAVACRDHYWRRRQDLPEDARIDRLTAFCAEMLKDAKAGAELAREVTGAA
jgi:hypothetical protein